MKISSPAPLLLALASGVAGHVLVVAPLLDAVRGATRGPAWMCPAIECTADGLPVTLRPMRPGAPLQPAGPPMREAPPRHAEAPWGGPFEASSLDTREIWRGGFSGRIFPMGGDLIVELRGAEVVLSPEAPAGVLRGLRVDLAEPTPDGSWRIVREGRPVELGIRFRNGERRRLPLLDLSIADVTGADLPGRWLVATMLVATPNGFSPLSHAHMDWSLAQAVAGRAVRAEALAGGRAPTRAQGREVEVRELAEGRGPEGTGPDRGSERRPR